MAEEHSQFFPDKTDALERRVDGLTKGLHEMSLNFDALATQVAAIKKADAAVVTTLQSVAAELKDMASKMQASAGDQAKLDAFADQLGLEAKKLADAVVANTPLAPKP